MNLVIGFIEITVDSGTSHSGVNKIYIGYTSINKSSNRKFRKADNLNGIADKNICATVENCVFFRYIYKIYLIGYRFCCHFAKD